MLDLEMVRLLETRGYINERGHLIRGTAALLHFLRLMDARVASFDQDMVDRGRAFLERFLAA